MTSPGAAEPLLCLSDHLGKRSVVLLFGSYTCSPFRAQAETLFRLQ